MANNTTTPKLSDAQYGRLLQARAEDPLSTDYLVEMMKRQGFDVSDSLLSYYKPPTESFNKYLKDSNIDPKSDKGVLFKKKWWESDRPYIKQYDEGLDDGKFTYGQGKGRRLEPDTLHVRRGSDDDFFYNSLFPDDLDWEKNYKAIKKEEKKSQSYLQKARDLLGW